MSKDMTPENKTIPEIWYDFLKISIEGDNDFGDPRGWHWFWSLYFLHKELPTFPSFQIASIKKVIPENHWLHKIDYDSIDKPLGPKPAEIYKLLQETVVFPAFLKAIKAIKNPEAINKIDFSQINFKELILEEPVNFSNFIFPIDASFEHAEFPHDIEFINAKFLKDAVFNNAKFSENAYFNDAIFCETADFEDVEFQEEKSHCKETAKFRNTTFSKIANFRNAIFWGYANFKGAKLEGRAFFQKAKFKYHAPRFYDATFNNEMTWAGIKLPEFKKAPVDDYKKIDDAFKNINCVVCTKNFKCARCELLIEENRRRRIEENQNSYENTAILLAGRKKFHDEHLFFRHEMGCRRELEENRSIRWAYALYEGLADYGYGIERAFKWWLTHIAIGIGAIMLMVFSSLFWECWKGLWDFVKSLLCAFPVSFSNANPLTFIGFEKGGLMYCYKKLEDLTPFVFGIIRTAQIIFGIPLLFLLLVTLRVRFRINNTK